MYSHLGDFELPTTTQYLSRIVILKLEPAINLNSLIPRYIKLQMSQSGIHYYPFRKMLPK